MELGVKMNGENRRGLRPREKLLINAGYKKVPTHCESFLQVDEEWISNVNKIGRSQFPRFHIMKRGREWFIHYDYFIGNKKMTKTGLSQIILNEIERLRSLK